MQLLEYLRVLLFQSSQLSWFIVGGSALILTVVLKIILHISSTFFRQIAKKLNSKWLEIGCDMTDNFKGVVIFGCFVFLFSHALPLSPTPEKILFTTLVALVILQVGIWGLDIIRHFREAAIRKKVAKDPSAATAIGLVYTSAQIAFIIFIVLVGLSNIGINIGALLTGLGVGGIAVALAAQNILSDLLASLSIVIDKPFVVGDFIIVGNDLGAVEYIGLKTTRIRSLSGEQLVFSNKDLLESRIRNCQRMRERRTAQRFTVVNSTPAEVLEQIPKWVRSAAEKYNQMRFERCHFVQYNNSNPEFEMVFWILKSDYFLYVDLQQKLLLDIHQKFAEEKVRLAYPSQSLFVEAIREPGEPEKRYSSPRPEPETLHREESWNS